MENLTLWKYLADTYGIRVDCSDTGWRLKQGTNTFSEGDFNTGALKSGMGLKQDIKLLNENKLAVLAVVHNILANQFKRDKKLQELFGATRVVARRRANG